MERSEVGDGGVRFFDRTACDLIADRAGGAEVFEDESALRAVVTDLREVAASRADGRGIGDVAIEVDLAAIETEGRDELPDAGVGRRELRDEARRLSGQASTQRRNINVRNCCPAANDDERRHALALHWSVSRGSRARGHWRAGTAATFLFRRREQRRVGNE